MNLPIDVTQSFDVILSNLESFVGLEINTRVNIHNNIDLS